MKSSLLDQPLHIDEYKFVCDNYIHIHHILNSVAFDNITILSAEGSSFLQDGKKTIITIIDINNFFIMAFLP
ncbi:MAG TPA: hypothetical protein VK590_04455 [Saprospiraceae bacterium]|nr:hypothetical protein [Saprospiraceae bacterium]